MAPRKLVYEAGKSAVIGMTRQMAIAFGPLGIRVNAICFLCSEEASFITGRALAADGGLTLQFQEDLAVDVAHCLREQPDTWLPY